MKKGDSSVKYIMRLAWPAILEQMLLTMATYVDTAMIGALGYRATAAVAVNASTTWLIMGPLSALGVGYSVQVAYSLGARDDARARGISCQALTGALCFGCALMLLFMPLSSHIPVWLGADEEILKDAQAYLFFFSAGIPFQALLNVFFAILRCSGDTRTPMYINVAANLSNVVLNFFLIFSPRCICIAGREFSVWGAGWGVAGAAIATSLSYALAAAALTAILFVRSSPVQLQWGRACLPRRDVTRKALRLGIPVAFERVATSSGQLVMTSLVTSLGSVALSANHVAVTAEAISYLPANGISFAGTTVIGQAVGAKRAEDARRDARTLGLLGLLAGTIGGGVLYFLSVPLAGLFSPDEEVIRLAAAMLRIVAVAEPMFGLAIVLAGVLRGAGKTAVTFWSVTIGMWCVRVTTAMLFLHVLHLGLHGLWLAMVADLIARGTMNLFFVKRLDWTRICEINGG